MHPAVNAAWLWSVVGDWHRSVEETGVLALALKLPLCVPQSPRPSSLLRGLQFYRLCRVFGSAGV